MVIGDSNTRGLNRRRLAMGTGSLSGATLDSVIAYINKEPTPNEAVKCVIYHLGTNNITDNTTDEIKIKHNTLKIKFSDKFLNAIVCFCEIPPNHNVPSLRITEVSEYSIPWGRRGRSRYLCRRQNPLQQTRPWMSGCFYEEMGKRKWTLIRGRFQEKPFLWKQQNSRKRMKFTMEEHRSSITAEKLWQMLSSCKPYHDTELDTFVRHLVLYFPDNQ